MRLVSYFIFRNFSYFIFRLYLTNARDFSTSVAAGSAAVVFVSAPSICACAGRLYTDLFVSVLDAALQAELATAAKTQAAVCSSAFGSVRSVDVGGRPRCVRECRPDISGSRTTQTADAGAARSIAPGPRPACLALPSAWVAAVFEFVVETAVSPSDVGYAQAIFRRRRARRWQRHPHGGLAGSHALLHQRYSVRRREP